MFGVVGFLAKTFLLLAVRLKDLVCQGTDLDCFIALLN